MAKRKVLPGGGSRKAPGVRKPKKTPPLPPAEYSTLPRPEEKPDFDGGLTFKQEQFVFEYLRCKGNAAEAYNSVYKPTSRKYANVLAHRLMKVESVKDAIETKREKLRRDNDITLEEMVTRLVAMWRTGPSELIDVFNYPGRRDSWRGLIGDKEFMVKEFSSGESGNTVKLHSTIEVGHELRKILGLKKATDPNGERDVTESVLGRVREIIASRKGEGSK